MLTELEKVNLRILAKEELANAWPKFCIAFVRQVMKRANITDITPEIMEVISDGMKTFNPMEQPGSLTDEDIVIITEIVNSGGK